MLKNGKKFMLLLMALSLSAGAFAGCNTTVKRDPLPGYESTDSAAQSNGGFVVKKDNWYYFINGAEDYTADNTYGKVVKGALMRISADNLAKGAYTEADVVLPELVVAQDYTSGIFVYGDYVYYASPNRNKNIEGQVETSYLDFRRAKLDGSEVMKGYYVQLSDNTTAYRYVEAEGTVYLLYVDSSNSEIHSVNTATGTDTVLVSGYSAYSFDTDVTSPYVYYTMPVAKKLTYPNTSNEAYNQLYRVSASATEADAAKLDLSDGYVDKDKKEGDEGYMMEYVNCGQLVLDGIGTAFDPTPFNLDYKEGVAMTSEQGYTYSLVKVTDGRVYLSVTNLGESSAAFVYAFVSADIGENWNSITANPNLAGTADGALQPIAESTTNAASSALYYTEGDDQYYIYLDTNSVIQRVKVGTGKDFVAEKVALANQQSGATLLYLDGDYLYFSNSGTNGKALYRINYKGASQEDYQNFPNELAEDYSPTKYLALDYNSSWYAPETVDGYLFFSNAETYADNYVYVLANPEDNDALKTLNDRYQEVQDAFTDISGKFSDASNAAKYYFYTGDGEILDQEEHKSEYNAEDFEVFDAFVNSTSSHGFTFDFKDDADKAYNVQSYFYNVLGKVTDDDKETIADSLATDLLLTAEEES